MDAKRFVPLDDWAEVDGLILEPDLSDFFTLLEYRDITDLLRGEAENLSQTRAMCQSLPAWEVLAQAVMALHQLAREFEDAFILLKKETN